MSSVVIAGDTSGSVTLAAPSVAGTTTLTLPATSGTIITTTGGVSPGTSGNVLTSDGTNWTSAAVGVPNGGYSLYYRLNSTNAGANSTIAQSIFGVGVTLAASTQYEFEYNAWLAKTAGTTSHIVSMLFGGTATFNNFYCDGWGFTNDSATQSGLLIITSPTTPQSTTGSITTATYYIKLVAKGTISVNSGGTFIPQYSLSAAPGGAYTTQIGSYFKLAKLGAAGANINIGSFA